MVARLPPADRRDAPQQLLRGARRSGPPTPRDLHSYAFHSAGTRRPHAAGSRGAWTRRFSSSPGGVNAVGAQPGPPTPVFITYATADRRIATATCRNLEDTGIDCWIAPRDVNPGESWPAAVTSAIERSRVMVVVLSAAAMRSDDVVREITLAAEERIAILPYRVDEVPLTGAFKYYLNPQHWLDASSQPLSQQHLDDLERALRRSLGAEATRAMQQREPVATLPPPPLDPRANRFADLAEARRRVAYYALERGVIWAVIGGAILVAWIWASRSKRPLLPSAIGVAFPAAGAGVLGGAL